MPESQSDFLDHLSELFSERILVYLNDVGLCFLRQVSKKFQSIVGKWCVVKSRQRLYGCDQIKAVKVEDIGIGWQNVVFPDGSLISSDGSITESMRWNHDHNSLCEVCGTGGEILLCDFCNLVYHIECLQPPLLTVPEGDWACPSCKNDDKRCPVIGSAILHTYKKKLFLTGGYHLRSFTPCLDLYQLDSKNEKWILHKCEGECPIYGYGNDQAFSIRKHVHAFSWTGNNISSQVLFKSLHTLSTKHCIWSRVSLYGHIPEPRIGHSLAVSRKTKKVFLFGGLVQGRTYKNDMYCLDLKNETWNLLYEDRNSIGDAFSPSQRSGHSLTLLGGRIWIIGGVGYLNFFAKKVNKRQKTTSCTQKKVDFLNDVHIWDISLLKWVRPIRSSGKVLSPRSGHSTVAVGNNIIIYGGCNSQKYLGDWFILHTSTMTWSRPQVNVTPTPRMRASFLTMDKSIILFGGGKRGFTSSPAINVEKYRGGMYEVTLQTALHATERQRNSIKLLYENDGDTEESKSHRAA